MEQPFIQEREGGSWTGPSVPCGVCLKFALQSQVILFKYIQEMKKTQPKPTNQPNKNREANTRKLWGCFFIFTKLMKILWCNGGLFSDHIKWVAIIKRGTEKPACPVEHCSNRSKNAPGHARYRMEDAAGHMAARFYPIQHISGMEAQCLYSPGLAVPPGRVFKVSKI